MIWLGMDLGFQNTDKEFTVFNRMYGEASGAYIYALINGNVAGGVGFRKLSNDICEMKRLYVYEDYRGRIEIKFNEVKDSKKWENEVVLNFIGL